MKNLFTLTLLIYLVFSGFTIQAQSCINDPELRNGSIVWPGVLSFDYVENFGTYSGQATDPITITACLLNITPVAGVSSVGGTFSSNFNWIYDPVSNCVQGTQNQTITGGSGGSITIDIVFGPSICPNNQKGFNAHLQPPSCMNGINETVNDTESYYTCELVPFGTNAIQGNVYLDNDLNCTQNSGDTLLHNWIVNLTGDAIHTTVTDINGNYEFYVDSGYYEVFVTLPNQLYQACIPTFQIPLNQFDTVSIGSPMQPTAFCPVLKVDISSSLLRRCTTASYSIQYSNLGTMDAQNAYVEVTFDTAQTVTWSSIPWTSITNNTYTIPLGTVPVNAVETIVMHVQNSCSFAQGESVCTIAKIYPDSLCLPPTNTWDGSITEVDGYCAPDSISFEITNVGMSPMSMPLEYYIVEDNVILRIGNFDLAPNETQTEKVVSNGSTYRIYAQQAQGYYPDGYQPTAAIEGCGVNGGGTFSTGFINNLEISDNTNTSLEFCQEIIGPYDPNDKSATPEGYGAEHYIHQNVDLNYRIRFQNVGSDTAFNVVIRDTLSDHLDITSLQQGAASHPYDLEIIDYNILKFTFPNIHLVDSLTNEPASHGHISFKISQLDSLPLGTMIYNSAGIYFDYEAPIITNQTWHEVGKDFMEILLTTEGPTMNSQSSVRVFPNPFDEYADIILEHPDTDTKSLSVCDGLGRVVLTTSLENNRVRIHKNQLPTGLYFFTISDQNQLIESGKIIIK